MVIQVLVRSSKKPKPVIIKKVTQKIIVENLGKCFFRCFHKNISRGVKSGIFAGQNRFLKFLNIQQRYTR